MNKLTDTEIVKSLESLLDRMRAYESLQASIGKGLVEDIISMYNRQKAEIERLQKHNTDAAFKHYRDGKTEGRREFAELIKQSTTDKSIDELLEEMEGEEVE